MSDFEYEIDCPHCGATFATEGVVDGRKARCPVCRGAIVVADTEPEGADEQAQERADAAPTAALPTAGGPWPLRAVQADTDAPAFVCLAKEEKVNPLTVGTILEEFTRLSRAEARRQVVTGKGLLACDLTLGGAQNLADILQGKGVDVFALPAAAVPERGPDVSMRRVYGADEEALHIQVDAEGTVKSLSWRRLVAGVCTEEMFPQKHDTGPEVRTHYVPVATVGMGVAYAEERQYSYGNKKPKPELMVTLVFADSQQRTRRLAFRESEVRFAYLGERAGASHRHNLAQMLGDIARWAPQAFFPAGFRAVARANFARATKTVGRIDYENYVTWAICCAAVRGPRSGA